MILTFLQVDKKRMLPELVQKQAYGLNVRLSRIFGIDQDVIQIYNYKDIELLCYDLIDISLKYG